VVAVYVFGRDVDVLLCVCSSVVIVHMSSVYLLPYLQFFGSLIQRSFTSNVRSSARLFTLVLFGHSSIVPTVCIQLN
jgi:hypothetical protein